MAAVELDDEGYPQHARFDPIDDTGATFAARARYALAPSAHLVSDGCASFNAAGAEVATHGAIVVGERKYSEIEPFHWVNTFISNVKTAIAGTYHHFDVDKYRHRYLAEAQYRFNRRFDLPSLVRRLARTCVRTGAYPERWLPLAEVEVS